MPWSHPLCILVVQQNLARFSSFQIPIFGVFLRQTFHVIFFYFFIFPGAQDLVTGGTSMKTLCGMSTEELASSHLKEIRKRIRDESYAGHMRQEDEGNEIVYKDGALQKIAKVKSEAKKQASRSLRHESPGSRCAGGVRRQACAGGGDRGCTATVRSSSTSTGGGCSCFLFSFL